MYTRLYARNNKMYSEITHSLKSTLKIVYCNKLIIYQSTFILYDRRKRVSRSRHT